MNIVFIGGGHMTRALVAGLCKHGGHDITVIDRNVAKRDELRQSFSVAVAADAAAVNMQTAEMIVLAVRPAQIKQVCTELAAMHKPAALVVSIAAGLRVVTLTEWLGGDARDVRDVRLVRAMPNTPAQAGDGMTACYAAKASTADRNAAEMLFTAVGKVFWVGDDALMDVATAVSGSGPAYVYYFVEAMEAAAAEMGLPPAVIKTAVLQTVRGAVAVLEQDGRSAADLRAAVAREGGTTERAIDLMREENMPQTIKAAMKACAVRAKEIGDSMAT